MSDDRIDFDPMEVEAYDRSSESEGNSLVDFLFPAPAPRTTGGIIKWWEKRRLGYNLIVGGTGLLSMGLFKLLTILPPDPHHIPLIWAPVIAYGILANICYTLGPTAEIFLEKVFKRKLLPTGPVLFRMGLTFSVGLTLLPTLLAVFDWVIRIVTGIF